MRVVTFVDQIYSVKQIVEFLFGGMSAGARFDAAKKASVDATCRCLFPHDLKTIHF